MSAPIPGKGPFLHRLLIRGFSVLFGLLLFWLIGFMLADIGKWERPDYAAMEKEYIPDELNRRLNDLNENRSRLQQSIRHQQETLEIHQTGMNSSEQTMKQFLEIHRLSIEKGIQPTEEQHLALSGAEALFVEHQQKFQEANQRISELRASLQEVEDQISAVQHEIHERREPLQEAFRHQYDRNRFVSACIKLAILIPLLLLSAWLVTLKRATLYAPLYYAAFIAVLLHTLWVMHQYFPKDFFKYLILAAAILTVVMLAVYLIRMAASPKPEWLIKRYKEAYRKRQCPVCGFSIEKGKIKYLPASQRFAPAAFEDTAFSEPYTCPACGTALFERCGECKSIRHALLPYCEGCGHEKPI